MSIERHMQLYGSTNGDAYNVRAIGTQDIENFCGEFAEYDPNGKGMFS